MSYSTKFWKQYNQWFDSTEPVYSLDSTETKIHNDLQKQVL